jgi:hypothetical protein
LYDIRGGGFVVLLLFQTSFFETRGREGREGGELNMNEELEAGGAGAGGEISAKTKRTTSVPGFKKTKKVYIVTC